MSDYPYRADQEGPAIPLEWRNRDAALYDFSTGWTFTAKVCAVDTTTVLLSKTTGITGAATSPNIVIDWSVSDFTSLTASAHGTKYDVHVYARRTADSKDFVFSPSSPPRILLFTAPA